MMPGRRKLFAERFLALKGEMSYRELSEDIYRSTGIRITPQAMARWAKGGGINAATLRAIAKYFGVSESYLYFGQFETRDLSLMEVLEPLSQESRRMALEYLQYLYERNRREVPRISEPGAIYDAVRQLVKQSRQEQEPEAA